MCTPSWGGLMSGREPYWSIHTFDGKGAVARVPTAPLDRNGVGLVPTGGTLED
jgi:hypothetical protein